MNVICITYTRFACQDEMTKNLPNLLLTESPGKVCGSYFNVASGQTTHITMCSFSTPFKVIKKTYRDTMVMWLWWLTPRQLHKHIEVYTNTTQPMHITMCSFWTPFYVIEKTQNYTKTHTHKRVSLWLPPTSTPWSNMCLRSKFTRTQTKPSAPPPSLLQILTTQKIM